MFTINTILREMNELPADRLEEVYTFVHSLKANTDKEKKQRRKKILSFAGAFSDMSKTDYTDSKKHTKKTRTKLFDRNIDI